jgi:hypothetical protein
MSNNPFAQYNIEMPKAYQDKIVSFCATGSVKRSRIRAPFYRQVDFWYAAFLIAVQRRLDPDQERDTYNVTPASILSTNPWRIPHIQASYFVLTQNLSGLAEHKEVFDFACRMANAGIPKLIQLLEEEGDDPMWSFLDEAEVVLAEIKRSAD